MSGLVAEVLVTGGPGAREYPKADVVRSFATEVLP